MLDVFILSFLRLFAFMKIKPHDGGLMKLSSSAVVWDEKRQSVFKQWVGTGAGQLWDWLGGYWPPMSSSCHLKGVTALQSLHPAKSTVGLLRMTLDWANHPPLWSSSLDGDAVPIQFFFFLVIIQSAVPGMQDMVPSFNPSWIKIFNWKVCFLHLAIVVT